MGFIFNSTQCALYHDFGIVVRTEQLIRIICIHIITNAQEYFSFNVGKVDALSNDACKFFESGILINI